MKRHKIAYTFRYSRGQDTYGYRVVSLYVDGVKSAMTVGVGYDQCGDVLGQWLTNAYNKRLQRLEANYGTGDNGGFYGLVHYNGAERVKRATKDTKTYVDGMCGRGSVARIMHEIGVEIFEVTRTKKGRGL